MTSAAPVMFHVTFLVTLTLSVVAADWQCRDACAKEDVPPAVRRFCACASQQQDKRNTDRNFRAARDVFKAADATAYNPEHKALLDDADAYIPLAGDVQQTLLGVMVRRGADLCVYLCDMQLGGEACKCSNPALPGR